MTPGEQRRAVNLWWSPIHMVFPPLDKGVARAPGATLPPRDGKQGMDGLGEAFVIS